MGIRNILEVAYGPDPYARATYWFSKRRKSNNYRKSGNVTVRKSDEGFEFSHGGNWVATLFPDSSIVIRCERPDQGMRYALNELSWYAAGTKPRHRVLVWSQSADNYAQNARVYFMGAKIPLMEGMRVANGLITNPEISVERVRVVRPEVRRAWVAYSGEVRALCQALVRLDTSDEYGKPVSHWERSHDVPDISMGGMEAAEALLTFGMKRVYRLYNDQRPYSTLLQLAMNNGLRIAREGYYEKHDAYEWKDAVPKELEKFIKLTKEQMKND